VPSIGSGSYIADRYTKLLAEIQTGEQAPIQRVNSCQRSGERTRRVNLLCLSLKFAFKSAFQQSTN